MIKLKLSDVQRDEIAEAIDDPSITERAKIKLLAIRLHSLDMPHGHIAAALNISDDTVTILPGIINSEFEMSESSQ